MFASNDTLAKIAKLIEQADHFRRHGEDGSADAALARADAMMTKYAIDRAMLDLAKPANTREVPTSVDIDFPDSEHWGDELSLVLGTLASGARLRVTLRPWRRQAILVGFPADIEYVQMLWTGIYLAFVSKIDPGWDADRPADENIKILKESGRSWGWIAEQANEHGFECTPNDGRLKAAYRRQCRAEGVEPTAHTQRHAAYRASFVQSFCSTVRSRLYRQNRVSEDIVQSSGNALVLADRFGDVEAKFYEMFPNLRPTSQEDLDKWREEEEARRAKLTEKQREAEDRRNARADARAQARWEREHAKLQDRAGSKAGRAAGESVDLGATKMGAKKRTEVGE